MSDNNLVKYHVVIDFDVIAHMIGARGLLPYEIKQDFYGQGFDLLTCKHEYNLFMSQVEKYLENWHSIHVKDVTVIYTPSDFTRQDYIRTWANPDYKSNRDFTKKEFYIPIIKDKVKKLNLESYKVKPTVYGLETDDYIGLTVQTLKEKKNENVLIVSNDKDFTFKFESFNPYTFEYKAPSLLNLTKLLIVGDKADNIEGLSGKGEAYFNKLVKECDADEDSVLHGVQELYAREGKDIDSATQQLSPFTLSNFKKIDNDNYAYLYCGEEYRVNIREKNYEIIQDKDLTQSR